MRRAIGEQATIGLYGVISRSGVFRSFKPLEIPCSHPRPGASASSNSGGIAIETDVDADAGSSRQREYDQLAWGYRDEMGYGGGGGEGVRDDDVVLSADECKRARIGNCGIARRRGFGDDKRRPWSAVRAFSFLA